MFEENGRLRVGLVLYVAHRGRERWLDVKLQIAQAAGAPQAKVIAVRDVKKK